MIRCTVISNPTFLDLYQTSDFSTHLKTRFFSVHNHSTSCGFYAEFPGNKRNSCILYHFVLTPMGIGLRRWSNNSRTWSHSWRHSWRSRWLNSNAWRVNYQRPKHGMKRGEQKGDEGQRWTSPNWGKTGRGGWDEEPGAGGDWSILSSWTLFS